MFTVDDLSKMDWDAIRLLPVNREAWEFWDPAPFDSQCENPDCMTDHKIPWIFSDGTTYIFACSCECAAAAVRNYRARLERREFQINAAVTVVPSGMSGSYKVIRPKQGPLF